MKEFDFNELWEKYNELVEEIKTRPEGIEKFTALETMRDVGIIIRDILKKYE